MFNLLNNAIKFSHQNDPIEVYAATPDERLIIAVRDYGIGVPEEKRAHLFEEFYQAHNDEHRAGIGIGLYICQQIATAHGGNIHAEFPDSGGSYFVVELPTDENPGTTACE
jgi:two-component system CheB/CheR fusion protein